MTATDVSITPDGATNDLITFDLTESEGTTSYTSDSLQFETSKSPTADTITWYLETGGGMSGINDIITIDDINSNSYTLQGDFVNICQVGLCGGASGTITLTPTPEPSTAILWLTGIGLMILTRKRIAHYLRPAPETHGALSPH